MSGNRCQHCGLRNWTFARVCDECGRALPKNEIHYGFQRVTDEELGTKRRRIEVNYSRCLSAFWFACAGSIPGLLIWWLLEKEAGQVGFVIVWFTTVPAGLAALYGALLGPRIIASTGGTTASGAFWRGGLIAFLSFLSLIMLLSLSLSSFNSLNFFVLLFLMLIYGSVTGGWEAIIIGGVAGWLFFKRHR